MRLARRAQRGVGTEPAGTGTLARHPDARWRASPDALATLVDRQRRLLDGAATAVRRGGWLVYATCSLEPEENDAIVEGFTREDITGFVPEGARSWVENGVLRLTPESGADGFTAFVLRV